MPRQTLRIELGGGSKPAGGFINCDLVAGPGVDVVIDFNRPLPWNDDTVTEVYSSHCLEHVSNVFGLLNEICRVCVVGARFTFAVPHYGQEMAMCPGHVHVISEQMIEHFREFPHVFSGPKKLVLINKSYGPTKYYAEAARLFPKLSAEQIYRFVSNTCHDVRFITEVRTHDGH